ncbi:MAG: energy transducer TonB [Bacteroidales bacterium]|nr:energy transducer TonB [Bacteroidales bacterium]
MEPKKTSKADLEGKRTIFIEIGLILALAVVLAAFEYRSYDKIEVEIAQRVVEEIPEEIVPITEHKPPPPPPTPPPQTTIISIVEDDVEVEDELIIDVDVDEDTEIEEFEPIEVEEEEVVEEEIFMVVEEQPTFPGGDAERMRFLMKNIKYPTMAKESGIQGTVYVSFVVEKNGKITDVRILRGIGGGCDEEAVRVVNMMPNWKAGKQRGKPVRVRFSMPIKFTLQS